MQSVDARTGLEQRLGQLCPELRPPVVLLTRLVDVLAGEDVLLACGDLVARGFGAYDGQLCLVTPTRVLLATASSLHGPDGFGLEHWDRQVGQLPRLLPYGRRVVPPAPRRG